MSQIVQIRRSPQSSGNPAATLRSTTPETSEEISSTTEKPTFYVETVGCQMNEADSGLIAGELSRAGYQRQTHPEQADVILINTCAVREKAEERVYGRTKSLAYLRKSKSNLVIGITGCMAEHLREKLEVTAPHVNLLAGPDSYRRIAELVDQARKGQRAVDLQLNKSETYEGLNSTIKNDGVSGFVSIQRGCDKFCTFCVVPYTRGRERGVAPREVLRQCRALADAGYREITLLGQTVNSYNYEDVSFAQLLRTVCKIDGIARVRFTSPYPVDFSDELIATIAEEDKLCPFVHLPVQSGSDVMLEKMRRGYSRSQYMELVEKLRKIPDIALSTDIMVGFCGETEDDHQQTLNLMQEVQFDFAFMFQYSDRRITYASKRMNDDVSAKCKSARLQDVIALQEKHTRAAHAARVGKTESILVTGLSRRKNYLTGRTKRFESVLLPLNSARPRDIVQRTISHTNGHSLFSL